jgi:2-haloacid dehalogenase
MGKPSAPQVLAFDVFGTVVDWHTSITAAVTAAGLPVDAGTFANAWRGGYVPALRRVITGKLGWTRLDDLHRMILDDILVEFDVADLPDEERHRLCLAWHALDPWPDSVEALTRLKTRFDICTLSNGNIAMLAHMAKHAGLPWDCILSAENFRHYKPEPEPYHGVADVFGVPESAVMLVAAHHEDLAAARSCGLQTAYVERPHEFGPDVSKDVSPHRENTVHVRDLGELATLLGC